MADIGFLKTLPRARTTATHGAAQPSRARHALINGSKKEPAPVRPRPVSSVPCGGPHLISSPPHMHRFPCNIYIKQK